MALTACRVCKTEISDKAPRCPHCGAVFVGTTGNTALQNTHSRRSKTSWLFWIVGGTCAIIVLGISCITLTVYLVSNRSPATARPLPKIDPNLLLYARMLLVWNQSKTYVEEKAAFATMDTTSITDADLIELHRKSARLSELLIYFGATRKDTDFNASEAVKALTNDVSKLLKDKTDYVSNWLELINLGQTIDDDWKRMDQKYRQEYERTEVWKHTDTAAD